MSNLGFFEKLLAEAEVEWKPLGDIARVFSGHAFASKHFNSIGEGLPLIRIRDVNTGNSDTYYSGKFDERYIVKNGDILIGMDGDFRAIRWRDGQALLNQRVCRLQDLCDEIDSGFLFYIVQGELDRIHRTIQGSTVKHLSSKELGKSLIPVPPLEVQGEIVRILDSFTERTAKLSAELTVEREACKKRYKYYRDRLLADENGEVKWLPMEDFGEFIRGKRFTKADFSDEGIRAIHYGEIYTHYGVFAYETLSKVRADMANSLRFAEKNDVVMAGVSETLEDVGKAVAWLGEDKVAIHDDSYAFRHPMNPKYIAYAMQTDAFHDQKGQFVSRGKIKRLLIDGMKKVKLPIPFPDDPQKSLAEQARIVAILDKFDALTTSLSKGLSREIELRQKQYEYYRDLLLTFRKPAEAAEA